MKFLLIASLAESLISFRGPLIAALQARGMQVHVAATPYGYHNSFANFATLLILIKWM